MKKRWIKATCASLCAMLLLFGCSSGSAEPPPYDYDLSEYLLLGQYKGIEVATKEVTVTEEEVQDEIERRLLQAVVAEEIREGFVEDGDVAHIDYEGRQDGVPFSGGTAQGHDLVIGSGTFIPGFEEGLLGVAIGRTVVIDLTFPEVYHNEELAGQDVEFEVTVHYVARRVPAVFDMAFVRENSDFESLADYRASVEEDLLHAKQERAEREKEDFIWMAILADCEVLQYPEKELQDFIERSKALYEDYAAMSQMTWVDFLLQQMGVTPEEFEEELENYAKQQIMEEMVLFSIARAEGMEVTEEEYEQAIQEFMAEQGYESERAFRNANGGQTFEAMVGRKNIEITLLAPEVFDFILAEAIEVPEEEVPDVSTGGAIAVF